MSSTPRYTDHSEYGDGDGGNYVTPADTPRKLSPGRRARFLRSERQHPGRSAENSPSAYDPATSPDLLSEQLILGFRR